MSLEEHMKDNFDNSDYWNDDYNHHIPDLDDKFFIAARHLFPDNTKYLLHLLAYEYNTTGKYDQNYACNLLESSGNSIRIMKTNRDIPDEIHRIIVKEYGIYPRYDEFIVIHKCMILAKSLMLVLWGEGKLV
jgi:hypothetical protein